MLRVILTAILFYANFAVAKQASISLDGQDHTKRYADDLVYKGERIDEIEAFELKKKGLDISKLNPYESALWQNKKHGSNDYKVSDLPSEDETLVFENFKASPTEFFRAYVYKEDDPFKRYLVVASLHNHTNVLRASLLRSLGYNISTPKYYKKVKIKFDSEKDLKNFIDNVGEKTLTKRDKWVVSQDKTSAVFRGLLIESAKLENVNIYLPVMESKRQNSRRVFRSLLDIYALTDFVQDVNKIGWSLGTVFNNRLILTHPYANEFSDVTIEDLKWIHRKLAKLSRKQIWSAVYFSGYPEDIRRLVFEKLMSRINNLSDIYNLKDAPKFKVNEKITCGKVKNGKLTKSDYSNYVVEYYNDDPLSPYRFSEIFRLFSSQLFYSALSGGLDTALEKLVPGLNVTDATEDIRERMSTYQEKDGSQLPTKLWSSPIANGRIFGSRNIVFGQYLNSNAPIQLVDTVGAEVNIGVYNSLSGISESIRPGITANTRASRTYIHIRAMPDLKTATKTHVKKLLIPRVMKKLGYLIDDNIKCSKPELVWVEEATLSDKPIFYVNYDQNDDAAKDAAIKKRQELLDKGIPTSQILLQKVDRNKICNEEVVSTRNKNMEEFLKEFADGETFIINDSIKLAVGTSIPIPLGTYGLPNKSSLNLTGDSSTLLLRGITIKRTPVGFEVTVQHERDIDASLGVGLSYFIELFNASTKWTKGKLISKVYKIQFERVSDEEKGKALTALRHLFAFNSQVKMQEYFPPYNLDHKVRLRLDIFRALFYKAENQIFNHRVDITIPKKDTDPKDLNLTRSLYSSTVFKREGNDYFSFTDRVIKSFVPFLGLGANSSGDPGKNFWGESFKRTYITESEITKNYPMNTMAKVETTYSGWKAKHKDLYYKFDSIEQMFYPFTTKDTIDKTIVNGSSSLISYDIRNTILLYKGAINKINTNLFKYSEAHAMKILKVLYGSDRYEQYCKRAQRFFGEHSPQEYFGERHYDCVPSSIQALLTFRRKGIPKTKIKYTEFITKVVSQLFENFKRDELLYWIDDENFFATTKVTGYRNHHVSGYMDYLSESVGTYDSEAQAGVYSNIASILGISIFELKAQKYTPGF